MQTTHSHHLSLHDESILYTLSPQSKILATLLIVVSIAFSKIINPFQIISHAPNNEHCSGSPNYKHAYKR